MPKIVDHDARREEVLEAFQQVVRRDGIDGVTIRSIAAEAGCSSGVLAHYFKDKDDILTSALAMANRRMSQRVLAVLERRTGLAALAEVLEQTLPLDEERALGLHLEVGMWGRAINQDALRTAHLDYYQLWFGLVSLLVGQSVDAGELPEGVDVELSALSLVAFVDGLAVDALMHPDRLPPHRQRQLLAAQIASLSSYVAA